MKNALFFLIVLFSLPCFAENTTAQLNLTAEQKAALIQQLNSNAPVATTEQVSENLALAAEWGSQLSIAAEGFAKALGIAAKEMGVAVNDFITTPAGILTAGIIVYKIFGDDIREILVGLFLVYFSISFFNRQYRQIKIKSYENKVVKTWRGERVISVPVYHDSSELRHEIENNPLFGLSCFFCIIGLIIGVIILA